MLREHTLTIIKINNKTLSNTTGHVMRKMNELISKVRVN